MDTFILTKFAHPCCLIQASGKKEFKKKVKLAITEELADEEFTCVDFTWEGILDYGYSRPLLVKYKVDGVEKLDTTFSIMKTIVY